MTYYGMQHRLHRGGFPASSRNCKGSCLMKLRDFASLALVASLSLLTVAASAADKKDKDSVKTEVHTTAPVAEKRDHSFTHHGVTISDPWHWLRDQSYPTVDDADVLAYLEAENAWFEARMAPHKELTETLFAEMRARIKEDDSTVPQKDGDWIYWSEFEEGAQYRRHFRKAAAGGDPVLILDENVLAEGHDYFRLGAASVSRNGRYLAYSTDTNGSERFTARIKDLETGELLADEITETRSGLTWAANDKAIVYGRVNDSWRVLNARGHWIGKSADEDVEIYTEADESFGVG